MLPRQPAHNSLQNPASSNREGLIARVDVRKSSINQPERPCLTRSNEYWMLSVLLFFGITIALAADYAIDKELSADGVNYFYLTVELRDFTHVDASRRFAQYILEWPLVLAIT